MVLGPIVWTKCWGCFRRIDENRLVSRRKSIIYDADEIGSLRFSTGTAKNALFLFFYDRSKFKRTHITHCTYRNRYFVITRTLYGAYRVRRDYATVSTTSQHYGHVGDRLKIVLFFWFLHRYTFADNAHDNFLIVRPTRLTRFSARRSRRTTTHRAGCKTLS